MHKFLFLFILFSCSGNSQKISKNDIEYFEADKETGWIRILNKQRKWGFINKDSIIQIPFDYDFINPFENGLAYAKIKGQEIFITKKNLRLKGDYEAINVFSEGLASIKKNGKWGFIDNEGNIIIHVQYDGVDYFRSSGLCAVTKNKKSGFINKSGVEIIPVIYDEARQEMTDQNVIVKKNNKWAVFSNSGKQLSDFIYDDLIRTDISDFSKDIFSRDQSTLFGNGAALAVIGGRYEFINAKAQAAFPNNKFDSASVFDTFNNAIVKRNGKYGIIKTDGTFKVPLEYDFIDYFDSNHTFSEYYNARKGKIYHLFNKNLKKIGESYEPVYNNFSNSTPKLVYQNLSRKYGVIDWQGKTLIPFDYDNLEEVEGTSFLWAAKGDLYGLISEQGQIKIPIQYKTISAIQDKFDDVKDINKLFFIADGMVIDINNNTVIKGYNSIRPIFYNHHKLIVSKNKKSGIIDINKKILLPLEYDKISNWVEYGPENRHFVVKNGKHGLIESETFRIIIPPVYDEFEQRDNLIFAIKDGKAGILDINNKQICPFIYEEVKPNYYGFGMGSEKNNVYAKKAGDFFQIDLKGNIIKKISERDYKTVTKPN
ncbi:WG repeat-containing protein [Chryseobacterium daecheongense]|uniref:WG repeat-containing protein n=1 Tax=Chryseobacterium daecheongense TaxID=192389 RepID=UPI001FD6D371|nr:WG repeat-containing protein [Chryseobacterium daecheongense]UOU99441.1 WG repeat-containing protein [Chryseobacterium daecheongense]